MGTPVVLGGLCEVSPFCLQTEHGDGSLSRAQLHSLCAVLLCLRGFAPEFPVSLPLRSFPVTLFRVCMSSRSWAGTSPLGPSPAGGEGARTQGTVSQVVFPVFPRKGF